MKHDELKKLNRKEVISLYLLCRMYFVFTTSLRYFRLFVYIQIYRFFLRKYFKFTFVITCTLYVVVELWRHKFIVYCFYMEQINKKKVIKKNKNSK